MLPLDELPWSGSDGVLAKVCRQPVDGRHDRGDGHREHLHEDRERLGECDDERAVVANV
mgnify:CR=1 FL=1